MSAATFTKKSFIISAISLCLNIILLFSDNIISPDPVLLLKVRKGFTEFQKFHFFRGSINQVALIALRLICTQFFLCSVLFPGVSISVCNVLFVQAFLYPDGFTHVRASTIFNIFLLLSHLRLTMYAHVLTGQRLDSYVIVTV